MKPLADAQRAVLDAVTPLPVVSMPLREARGLVLAAPLVASHDLPPFSNSAMDGYAVRAADVEAAPVTLPVLEDVPAGRVPSQPVTAGTAIKIMTGAPLPEGADAVVKVEDTEPGDGEVRILAAAPAGTSVRPAGGDVAAGTEVFPAGLRLTPARLGVCASLGVAMPQVRQRPRVAILSTGDELVPAETANLAPGKIRDSNRFLLRGLLEELGVIVVDYGIVGDDATALNQVLGHAAANSDAVVTSGGVSMGEYDLVKSELARLGSVDFWRVAMQPGKPFAFGNLGGTPFFGLPGNPVSVVVSFGQFLRPALLAMMGATHLFRSRVTGILDGDVRTDPAKAVFLRVAVTAGDDGRLHARLSGAQGSNIQSSLAAADAFAVVPVGVAEVAAGDLVELELFGSPAARTREEALGG